MNLPGCVACHSNHQIKHPTDEMIGTGPKAVCVQCHSDGDAGFQQATAMSRHLTNLSSSITSADEILGRAEREGMDVSQQQQQEANARDALLKARVSVHAFREDEVKRDTDAGLVITKATYAGGQQAMQEWKYRRVGLGLSLSMIVLTLIGLGLYIRNLERE
jgi:predicted CXXCH cytochrome family protein